MRIKAIWLLALAAFASFVAFAYWRAFPHGGPRHHGLVFTYWLVCCSLAFATQRLGQSMWRRIKAARQPG